MKFGYVRISTQEQNHVLQMQELQSAGVDKKNIFVEKMSGGVAPRKRPVLSQLLVKLQEGDRIVVWKLGQCSQMLA